MQYFTLSNGVKIPAVGSGTNSFAKTDGVFNGSTKEVISAIEAGYTFFDTAESYRNEEAVGDGIIESGVGRENIFVATKMATRSEKPLGRNDAVAAIERSLNKLKTDYIDLYLIHFPWEKRDEEKEVWETFEEYYRKGVLKAIGVCNHMPDDLEFLIKNCEIKPMVNQVKCNPDEWNKAAVDFSQANGIIPIAWGPLKFAAEHRPPIEEIGRKYGKTWAQTILRYHFQRGVISIPKSHSFEHQKENLDIFDFELTPDEMRIIAG